MINLIRHLTLGLVLGGWAFAAQAFELIPQQVDDNIWALVGDIAPRTPENHALNNTLGLVVTPEGAILIGSGATPTAAVLVEQTVARITDHPIRWVINIGAQDHHWLGNSYFAAKGIPIIALARTVAAQKQHVDIELNRLQASLDPDEVAEIRPTFANKVIDADHTSLELGGLQIELIWPGNGHFAGDAVAWLPAQRVVFAGDFVFNDRMLGVQPYSHVVDWRDAFERIAALDPKIVIPGHGRAGDLAKARRDTGDYLAFLVEGVGKALEDWKELGETTDLLSNAPQFRHLKFFDDWHRRNINHTYLQMEAAQ